MNPRKLVRPLRFVLFAVVAVLAGLFLRGRAEYLEINDRSMYPRYQPGDRLAIRAIDEDDPVARGDWVLFAIETTGYCAVVRGLPGDIVGATDGRVTVNGKPVLVHGRPFPGNAAGAVPDGHYYVLCLNPDVQRDSRRFGFIARGQVKGIILHEE